jgi:hypothetical protein
METGTGTETRTESFPCEGPAELDVRIHRGRVEVRVTDNPHVRVELSAAPGDVVRDTLVEFSSDRRKLTLRARRSSRRGEIDVVVETPSHSRVKVQAHRGSIHATGSLSELVAASGQGSISADEVEGPVQVTSGSGAVKLGRVSGKLRARLGSGDLEIGVLAGEQATLATGLGDARLGVVRCDTQVRTGCGSIVVAEHSGGDLTLASGNGDLRVAIRPGLAAELDLGSGSGQARSELDVSDRPPADVPAVRIRLRTGSGEAVVARAAA